MRDEPLEPEVSERQGWVGWCCSYCSAPLEPKPNGLFCAEEGRWFGTVEGVHRLLPQERRQELQAFLEFHQRVRRADGWRLEMGLPEVLPGHPHETTWLRRAAALRAGRRLVEAHLGTGPWRVLEVGAGCCWAGLRLLDDGHRVAAIDVNLDPADGLTAANRLLESPSQLPRAEADMEELPLEPAHFDLVLASGSLHHAPRTVRTLVELRRVTRPGGALLILDSPVFRRRQHGEAMVADRMREHVRRFSFAVPREAQPSYFALGELVGLFRGAGWQLQIHGWPSRAQEWLEDVLQLVRLRRRRPRFPILLARRDG
jgi:SAM-dependent methyltransferase